MDNDRADAEVPKADESPIPAEGDTKQEETAPVQTAGGESTVDETAAEDTAADDTAPEETTREDAAAEEGNTEETTAEATADEPEAKTETNAEEVTEGGDDKEADDTEATAEEATNQDEATNEDETAKYKTPEPEAEPEAATEETVEETETEPAAAEEEAKDDGTEGGEDEVTEHVAETEEVTEEKTEDAAAETTETEAATEERTTTPEVTEETKHGEPEDDEQIKLWRDTFSMFDKNSDGHICTNELGTVMRAMGQNPTNANVEAMMAKLDADNSGYIDFGEFSNHLKDIFQDEEKLKKHLMEAFSHFDRNGDGTVSAEDIMYAVSKLGEPLSEEEACEMKNMIQTADCNNDGVIQYEEYVRFMTS